MEKFAGYGFNKSHAAAYALVAYQTAYLKAHHPAAFMAANMSAVMDDTDKVHQLLRGRARQRPQGPAAGHQRFGVPLRAGRARRQIRYGLGAIKGTGESAIEAILEARRQGGPVPRPVRLLPPRGQARRQPARARGADPCRRLRQHRRSSRQPAGLGRHRHRRAPSRRVVAAAQNSLFGGESGWRRAGVELIDRAALEREASGCWRRSRRSASTSAGIRSRATRARCAAGAHAAGESATRRTRA